MTANVPGYDFQTMLKIAICIDITRLGLILASLNAADLPDVKAKTKRAHCLLWATISLLILVTALQFTTFLVYKDSLASELALFIPEVIFDLAILIAYLVIYFRLRKQYFTVQRDQPQFMQKIVKATERSIQILFVSIA